MTGLGVSRSWTICFACRMNAASDSPGRRNSATDMVQLPFRPFGPPKQSGRRTLYPNDAVYHWSAVPERHPLSVLRRGRDQVKRQPGLFQLRIAEPAHTFLTALSPDSCAAASPIRGNHMATTATAPTTAPP